jgi:YVTN family beta-propeller protein
VAGVVVALAVLLVLPGVAVHPGSTPMAPGLGPAGPSGPSRAIAESRTFLVRGAGESAGSIVSTIDLVANKVDPGTAEPAVQDIPGSVTFDPLNEKLYIRGDVGDAISVVNTSTETVEATIPAYVSQNSYSLSSTFAVDTTSGEVYAANTMNANLSVIDPQTDEIVGGIAVGGAPNAMVFDPANGDLYVANWQTGNVSVVSGTSHSVVATVAVGSRPGAILYDPASNQVFVANYMSGNVTVIDAATNLVVANLSTGSVPIALVLDTDDDEVDVANEANGAASHVTVLDATTDSIAGNVTVGGGPQALAYAPREDVVVVANAATNNVSVINQSTGSVVATIGVGVAPAAAVFDAANGEAYVLNAETPNLTAIDLSTDAIVGSVDTDNGYAYGLAVSETSGEVFAVSEGTFTMAGPPPHAQANVTVVDARTNLAVASVPLNVYPVGVLFDPANGNLVVADPGGNDTYLVDPATEKVVGTAPAGFLPKWFAYDSRNREMYVVDPGSENITVYNASMVPVASIPTGYSPTAIAFDSANGDLYVTDNFGGNVSVIDGANHTVLRSIVVTAHAILDGVLYDPHTTEVYVSDFTGDNVTEINGSSQTIVGATPVGFEPVSLAFDPHNDTIFVANTGSGNVSVINDSTNAVVHTISLSGYSPGVLVYDPSNNLLYDAFGYDGDVSANDASNYTQVGSNMYLGTAQYPSGIAYDPVNTEVFVTDEYADSISVLSSVAPATEFPVTFTETGLANGTTWGVNLNGTPQSSTSKQIGFESPNGSVPFTVLPVSGYTPDIPSGSADVRGGPTNVTIVFTASSPGGGTYAVTFNGTGLPSQTSWSVTLAGGSGTPTSSTTDTVSFTRANGSWSYSVGVPNGYTAAPSKGVVNVSGHPNGTAIVFTANQTAALAATLAVAPGNVTLGASGTFTTTATGGTAPYSYQYAGLPTGCTSASVPSLVCTSSVTGTFSVTVTVRDAAGHTTTAGTTFHVLAARVGPSSSNGVPLLAIVLGAIAVIFIVLFFWWRRKRRPPVPNSTTAPAASGPGSPPGTTP